jgi:hypothetical protein
MSFAVTVSSHRNKADFCEKIAIEFRVVNTCNILRGFQDFQILFDFL